MKKGFTLIELSMVLIIIGIIVGMTMAGRTLVETAKMRAEVNKIEKINEALLAYSAKHAARTLPVKQGSILNIDILINEGILQDKDIFSEMSNEAYSIRMCRSYDEKRRRGFKDALLPEELCAVNIGMTKRLVCNVELILDNNEETTGLGRLWDTAAADGIGSGSDNYTNCDNLYGPTRFGYGYIIYR